MKFIAIFIAWISAIFAPYAIAQSSEQHNEEIMQEKTNKMLIISCSLNSDSRMLHNAAKKYPMSLDRSAQLLPSFL